MASCLGLEGWRSGVEMRVEMDGDTEMWLLVHGKKQLTNMLHRGKKGILVPCCNFDNA